MRYAWDLRETYLEQTGLAHGVRGRVVRRVLDRLQEQDLASNATITRFVANSANVARRIARLYGRDADVIHPPVDTERFVPDGPPRDHYVTVSRLVPYKRVDLLVDAFARMPGRRLVVAGGGPELSALRARATPNVEVRGHVADAELVPLVQTARAFVFAADEDFGIAPLEAQACGVPVIALDREPAGVALASNAVVAAAICADPIAQGLNLCAPRPEADDRHPEIVEVAQQGRGREEDVEVRRVPDVAGVHHGEQAREPVIPNPTVVASLRRDRLGVDPVRDHADLIWRRSLGDQALAHPVADRDDVVGPLQVVRDELAQGADEPLVREPPELRRDLREDVLADHDQRRAIAARDLNGQRSDDRRVGLAEHQVGSLTRETAQEAVSEIREVVDGPVS
jgi:hypothetical protein